MPPYRDAPTSCPAAEKKALLIGIRYDHHEVGEGWEPIPTSISNVKRIAALLESEHSRPLSVFIRSHNPFVPFRALWVYGHCYNDRRR